MKVSMGRPDFIYVNLPRSLVEIVDKCVSEIFQNGAQVYGSRKDFVIKSVQDRIEKEKKENQILEKKISKLEKQQQVITTIKTAVIGGNRRKNVA